jgi:hypothetical protein
MSKTISIPYNSVRQELCHVVVRPHDVVSHIRMDKGEADQIAASIDNAAVREAILIIPVAEQL